MAAAAFLSYNSGKDIGLLGFAPCLCFSPNAKIRAAASSSSKNHPSSYHCLPLETAERNSRCQNPSQANMQPRDARKKGMRLLAASNPTTEAAAEAAAASIFFLNPALPFCLKHPPFILRIFLLGLIGAKKPHILLRSQLQNSGNLPSQMFSFSKTTPFELGIFSDSLCLHSFCFPACVVDVVVVVVNS